MQCHFRNWHALIVVVTPDADPLNTGVSGEKKGDLPCDKAPLISLRNDLSNLAVTFFVAIDTSCGVNQFLLAGVKRVAGGTDLGVDLFSCGACLECITAQTLDGNLGIFRVNAFFHLFLLQ